MAEKFPQVAVIMVPFPGQGHINPLLHLSRLFSAHNVSVHFVGTTAHNRQAQDRVEGWDPSSATNMHFQNFPMPPEFIHDDSPPPNLYIVSTSYLRDPVYAFVNKLSTVFRKVVVIYDYLMSYVVQDIHSIQNAKGFRFQSSSAFQNFCFHREVHELIDVAPLPLPPFEAAEVLKETPSLDGILPDEAREFFYLLESSTKVFSGDIYNSNREIEPLYFDLLEKEKSMGAEKAFGLGPFNPVLIPEQKADSRLNRHKCLDWLDEQGLNSVIFVSFGTTCSFSDEQIKEIAYGLERSECKFIWVLRDADKQDGIFACDGRELLGLPQGFEERVKERGVIVRDWAPQLEILSHSATGGFLSHCGWNSCIESISMGVAIATWPVAWDQPKNAVLITKVLKIGVEVVDWERRGEVVSADTLEKAIKKLMASEEGREIRKRAKELGNTVKKSVLEGGVARKEIDLFIAHINR